jgi:hypothetical protein
LACSRHLANPGLDGACYTGAASDLATMRGAFVALVELRGAARPFAYALVGELVKICSEIPPDVDRLVALRATLDRGLALAAEAEPASQEQPTRASVLVAALAEGKYAAVNAGECRAYHIRASGRIDRVRLEPSTQREIELADSLIMCSAAVTEAVEEVELALDAYSREPADAARRLVAMAAQRGARAAVLVVAFGPGRSLREKMLGRSNGAGT